MPTLAQALVLVLQYKYAIMLPLAIIEGPILSVIGGFLMHQGYLDFWPMYLTLMLGDLIGDTVWYAIGRHAARPFINRYGHKFGFTDERIAVVDGIFKRHKRKTLLISKLTTGFGLAPIVLMTAGSLGIGFGEYILLNTIGQFAWSGFLIVMGVYFGKFYVAIDAQFRTMYMIAVVVLLVLGMYFLQRYLRKKYSQKRT